MAKTRHINFKISEADYRKIESMKNGKTIGHLMRNLIAEAVETERKEARRR
ncbi:MAG: hypothetical protein HY754_11345 [Nitrospirae bacterium]|nr:hypothetical protein [Nitrospirota bacterium]